MSSAGVVLAALLLSYGLSQRAAGHAAAGRGQFQIGTILMLVAMAGVGVFARERRTRRGSR